VYSSVLVSMKLRAFIASVTERKRLHLESSSVSGRMILASQDSNNTTEQDSATFSPLLEKIHSICNSCEIVVNLLSPHLRRYLSSH
jgi:hypothetical protein